MKHGFSKKVGKKRCSKNVWKQEIYQEISIIGVIKAHTSSLPWMGHVMKNKIQIPIDTRIGEGREEDDQRVNGR